MSADMVSVQIRKPPAGFEVVGFVVAQHGDIIWNGLEWGPADWATGSLAIVARRRKTLADWLNEQPDFQVLARLCSNNFRVTSDVCGLFGLGGHNVGPKPPMLGRAITENGKWVDE